MITRILSLFLTCATLLAQRTPFKVNGTVVDNPNLTNSATVTWNRSGANVTGTATATAAGNWIASGTTNSTIPGSGLANALVATQSVTAGSVTISTNAGIGVAPASGKILSIKGTTTDSTAYQIQGFDSSSRETTGFFNNGRLNLTCYDSGGIVALYNYDTPVNNAIGGHYAYGSLSSNSHPNTIVRLNAFITDITPTNLHSKFTLQYMNGVNSEPGGVYSYQQPNETITFSELGIDSPVPLRLGNSNYAASGNIRLTNNSFINWRKNANDGDVTVLGVTSSDAVFLGGANASLVAFQSSGTTRAYFDSAALNMAVSSVLRSASSGTDTAGNPINISSGAGTGTGKSGAVNLKTAPFSTTGSSANTLVDRFIVAPEFTLTDAAKSIFEVALPTLRSCGGVITWTVEATDGTDVQSYSGITVYASVNKGGAYTSTLNTTGASVEAKAVSGGTQTGAWSIVSGTNKITLTFTPNGSLTETTYRLYFTITNNSRQAITLL